MANGLTSPSSNPRTGHHPATARRYFLILLGALTAFSPLSTDMYLPAFPDIATEFGVSLSRVQGTMATFFLGMATGQLVHGPLSDRYGRRLPLLGGIAIFVVASAACAFAPSVDALYVARFFAAVGGSAGIVMVRAVVRDLYAVEDSARIFSRLMLVMGAAPMLAPSVGSAVLAVASWRVIFGILTAFGLLAWTAAYFGLPETHAGTPGAARPAQALRTFGQVLADRRFLAPAAAASLGYCALFAYLTASSSVLIATYHLSPRVYAVVFGATSASFILNSQVNARLVRRHAPRKLLHGGLLVLLLVGVAELIVTASGFGGAPTLIALWLVQMGSLGYIAGNAAALALAEQGPRAGSAAALLGSAQFGSGGVAGAALGLLGPLVGTTARAVGVVVATSALCAWLLRPWRPASAESPTRRP